MPWLEADPVTERKRFIMEWQSGELNVTELCRRHGISRTTGYKGSLATSGKDLMAWRIARGGPTTVPERPIRS